MGENKYIVKFEGKGICAKGCKFAFKTSADGNDFEIVDPEIIGGCPGQCEVLAVTLNGMNLSRAVELFGGIQCGSKSTSCAREVVNAMAEQAFKLL